LKYIFGQRGSTGVEQLPHHPKVEGLSPAPSAATGREKKEEKCRKFAKYEYVKWFPGF
jgi:hypothetical protein